MNNIKKLALGLLVAAFAFGFSAFTNPKAEQVKKLDGEQVGYLGPNNWILAPEADENNTWECIMQTSPVCTGHLKSGAIPNPDGSYNDSDVDYTAQTNRKFVEN